jgi:hypothetical protein
MLFAGILAKRRETVSRKKLSDKGYYIYNCGDIFNGSVNYLFLKDRFERYHPKYVPVKDAGGCWWRRIFLFFIRKMKWVKV